jgi:hypothetical protein
MLNNSELRLGSFNVKRLKICLYLKNKKEFNLTGYDFLYSYAIFLQAL